MFHKNKRVSSKMLSMITWRQISANVSSGVISGEHLSVISDLFASGHCVCLGLSLYFDESFEKILNKCIKTQICTKFSLCMVYFLNCDCWNNFCVAFSLSVSITALDTTRLLPSCSQPTNRGFKVQTQQTAMPFRETCRANL